MSMMKTMGMREHWLLMASVALLALSGCGVDRVKDRLSSPADSAGYAIGLDIGEALDGALSVPLDFAAFAQGIRDTLQGDTVLLDADDRAAMLERFSRGMYGAAGAPDSVARAGSQPPQTLAWAPSLETDPQRMSYAVGVSTGANLRRMGGEIDIEAIVQGVIDTLYGLPTMLDRTQAIEVQRRFVETARDRIKADMAAQAVKNAEEAARFLEANARREGVRTTESGLQYLVLREGTGTRPDSSDRVRIRYTGRLADSTVIDSTHARGEPRTVLVGGMVRGWVEGLQLMREGARYRFFVPPALGYGKQGRRGEVPTNAVLVFDIELLEVLDGAGG